MPLFEPQFSFVILLVGLFLVVSLLVKHASERIGIAPLVWYILLGFAFHALDRRLNFMQQGWHEVFEFLSLMGVFALLFRVGLDSDFEGLRAQLGRASLLWLANIVGSFLIVYWVCRGPLDMGLLPALVAGVALSATSIAVSVRSWQQRDMLKTSRGALLLDVAELDDISGVILMAVLFSVAPQLREGWNSELWGSVALRASTMLLLFALVAAGCYLYSRFLEARLTRLFEKLSPRPDTMLTVVGMAAIIAGLVGFLGFSIAIGAFFAGLIYSRDPDAVAMEKPFRVLYDFFTPFFFIGVGMRISPSVSPGFWGLLALLFAAALLGKWIGPFVLLLARGDARGGNLLGLSLVPRAEIALIIASKALELGPWAMPPALYNAVVVVSLLSCLLTPLVLGPLLGRHASSE